MAQKVMTAPLALIKVNDQVVGLMKNIRMTETIGRRKVTGIGRLTPKELAATDWDGKLDCSFHNISMEATGIPGALQRNVPDLQAWVDNVLLQEDGVDVVIYRKVEDGIDTTTNLINSKLEPFATVRGCFIDRDGFDISEGQISGRDQSFSYLSPVLFIT